MKIWIVNKTAGTLSLDIPTDWGDPIRKKLTKGAQFDVGDILTIAEANKNDMLQQLYTAGTIDIVVDSEAEDIEPLVAADGMVAGITTLQPHLNYTSPSQITVTSHPGYSSVWLELQDGVRRQLVVPVVFDTTVSGAGGLDTGSEASSTWYYLYAGAVTADDSTLELVGSVSPPSTGPTGYVYWKYIGACYNDSSGDIIPVIQDNNSFQYPVGRVVQQLGLASISTEGSPVQLSLANFVPQTAGSSCVSVILRGQVGSDGFVELYVHGYQSVGFRFHVPVTEKSDNVEISRFPTPTSTKAVWRRFQENIPQIDQFSLICLGWFDTWLI